MEVITNEEIDKMFERAATVQTIELEIKPEYKVYSAKLFLKDYEKKTSKNGNEYFLVTFRTPYNDLKMFLWQEFEQIEKVKKNSRVYCYWEEKGYFKNIKAIFEEKKEDNGKEEIRE